MPLTIQQEEYLRPDFDYLDYQENEARLERLRSENMQFYSNFTLPPPQTTLPHIPLISQREQFECSPRTLIPAYGELMQKRKPELQEEEDPEIARMRDMLLST